MKKTLILLALSMAFSCKKTSNNTLYLSAAIRPDAGYTNWIANFTLSSNSKTNISISDSLTISAKLYFRLRQAGNNVTQTTIDSVWIKDIKNGVTIPLNQREYNTGALYNGETTLGVWVDPVTCDNAHYNIQPMQ
jgi:hypothetical protein